MVFRILAAARPDPPGPVLDGGSISPHCALLTTRFPFPAAHPFQRSQSQLSSEQRLPLPFPRKPQLQRRKTLEAAPDAAWVPVMEEEVGGASGNEEVVQLQDAVELLVEHLVEPVLPLSWVDREEALSPETQEPMARQVRKLVLDHVHRTTDD